MNRDQLPALAIVVPCYNEEEVLSETITQLTKVLTDLIEKGRVHARSRLVFVDDGSEDRTWSLIAMASVKNSLVTGVKLARNVGHQNALLAGLESVRAMDCAITIDADLQDDILAIYKFIDKFHEGYDIVYGVRRDRSVDSRFKRYSAISFYRLLNKLGVPVIENHADFRLLSQRAMKELFRFQEAHIFLRGIIPHIGLPSTKVYYDRKVRLKGETKYPLKKMLALAMNGITSFSIMPIRLIALFGGLLLFLGLAVTRFALIQHSFDRLFLLFLSLSFISGLQFIALGIIGEYIGKMFFELKARPKYTVEIDLFTKPMLPEVDKNLSEDGLDFTDER